MQVNTIKILYHSYIFDEKAKLNKPKILNTNFFVDILMKSKTHNLEAPRNYLKKISKLSLSNNKEEYDFQIDLKNI